ncbi:hypothetical protein HaLaN_14368 [Haematococcus lacustris]|uniref:Uncharacterized protein n=1 Tax=Haematococcus lacustris TaxID=44745 RepID=A0A699ZFJ8_HAELA|nr:hypothetical protein HaLaN_14368 [Haematococcus lacustris]
MKGNKRKSADEPKRARARVLGCQPAPQPSSSPPLQGQSARPDHGHSGNVSACHLQSLGHGVQGRQAP